MDAYGVRPFGQDYRAAEREADLVAGDTGVPMALVEDFTTEPGKLHVSTLADAEEYISKHDAEIQYSTAPLSGEAQQKGAPCE